MATGYDRSTTLDWCRGIDAGPFSSVSCGERITYHNQELLVANAAAAALDRAGAGVREPGGRAAPPLAPCWPSSWRPSTCSPAGASRSASASAAARATTWRPRRRSPGATPGSTSRSPSSGATGPGEPLPGQDDAVGPAPVQEGGPPLLAGAMGPKALARAAVWADGVSGFSLGADPDEMRRANEAAVRAWTDAGRDRGAAAGVRAASSCSASTTRRPSSPASPTTTWRCSATASPARCPRPSRSSPPSGCARPSPTARPPAATSSSSSRAPPTPAASRPPPRSSPRLSRPRVRGRQMSMLVARAASSSTRARELLDGCGRQLLQRGGVEPLEAVDEALRRRSLPRAARRRPMAENRRASAATRAFDQVLGAERGRALPADVGEVAVAVAEVGGGRRLLPTSAAASHPHEPARPSLQRRPTGPARPTPRCSHGGRAPPPAPGPPRPAPSPRAPTPATCSPSSDPSGAAATSSKDARSVRNGPAGSVHAARWRACVAGWRPVAERPLGVAPPHQRELEPAFGGDVAERRVGHGRWSAASSGPDQPKTSTSSWQAARRRRPPVRRSPPRPSASVIAEDRPDTGGVAHERRRAR